LAGVLLVQHLQHATPSNRHSDNACIWFISIQ